MHPLDTLEQVAAWARARGLNLVGQTDAETFDRCQPSGRRAVERDPACRSILVLGGSGPFNWNYLKRKLGPALAQAAPDAHPIDDWSRDVAAELLSMLRLGGICDGSVLLPNDRPSLNFVQLGECAGVGTISPVLEQLVHPEFGPWITLRAAILLHGQPFAAAAREVSMAFQPCDGCAQPCAKSCPADVYGGMRAADVAACVRHRVGGGCAIGCDARRGCTLGVEHRPREDEERFRHAHSMFMIQAAQSAAGASRSWLDRLRFLRRH